MDQITNILRKFIPEENINELTKAIEKIIENAVAKLEAEYQNKLEEAYEIIARNNFK